MTTPTDHRPPQSDLSPAEALRERLTQGSARLWVLLATTLVWVMDVSLFNHIKAHHIVANTYSETLHPPTVRKVVRSV